MRSPWFSGLLFLAVAVVVMAALLVAGRVRAPIVIVGALLSVSVVGDLQVRQDDRLNERGSLRLMADPLRRRPLVLTRRPGGEAGGRTR
jgi:hypothetical protein